tara:strand:- start:636 stop:1127 length:492 start_codon:yes stop_codon:yes gene_type:complete
MDLAQESIMTRNNEAEMITGAEADRSWTVLLVEDNPDDDMQARRVLEKARRIGDVVSCRDAHMLFDQINNKHLNKDTLTSARTIILLDIHLPGIDGMVLLEQLKTSPLTENIPIIILTGDEDLDRVYQAYKKHANAFVLKPLQEHHLKDIYTVFDKGSNWKEK